MTSGYSSWTLLDLGQGYVCFVATPDESSISCCVEKRLGRTNLELAREFEQWVDWEHVAQAVGRAIELGGHFEGKASDLDNQMSESCVIDAFVDLI